jgi:hypothetical protein
VSLPSALAESGFCHLPTKQIMKQTLYPRVAAVADSLERRCPMPGEAAATSSTTWIEARCRDDDVLLP